MLRSGKCSKTGWHSDRLIALRSWKTSLKVRLRFGRLSCAKTEPSLTTVRSDQTAVASKSSNCCSRTERSMSTEPDCSMTASDPSSAAVQKSDSAPDSAVPKPVIAADPGTSLALFAPAMLSLVRKQSQRSSPTPFLTYIDSASCKFLPADVLNGLVPAQRSALMRPIDKGVLTAGQLGRSQWDVGSTCAVDSPGREFESCRKTALESV